MKKLVIVPDRDRATALAARLKEPVLNRGYISSSRTYVTWPVISEGGNLQIDPIQYPLLDELAHRRDVDGIVDAFDDDCHSAWLFESLYHTLNTGKTIMRYDKGSHSLQPISLDASRYLESFAVHDREVRIEKILPDILSCYGYNLTSKALWILVLASFKYPERKDVIIKTIGEKRFEFAENELKEKGFLASRKGETILSFEGKIFLDIMPEWFCTLSVPKTGNRTVISEINELKLKNICERYTGILPGSLSRDRRKVLGKCPLCGEPVMDSGKVAVCHSRSCNFRLFKTNEFLRKNQVGYLKEGEIASFLAKGKAYVPSFIDEAGLNEKGVVLSMELRDEFPYFRIAEKETRDLFLSLGPPLQPQP